LGGQALRTSVNVPPASIKGLITMDEVVVGKGLQSDSLSRLKVYLFKAEDCRPLVELQESCRRAIADPHADPLRAYNACHRHLTQAVALVPRLPSVDSTETDRQGSYRFENVPAAGRYQVVGVKMVQGAEPLVIVGVTGKLKAGESVTLNLSANDPWTRAATPRP
jgi:hypothetical protein